MATIDYATCRVNDVIAHSLKLHLRLLADCLRFDARVHTQFADADDGSAVMRNELDLARRLCSFVDAIELGDHTIPDNFDVRRAAYSCAAQLQDLHSITQNLIAERDQLHAPLGNL
jgi:hypothetical protein